MKRPAGKIVELWKRGFYKVAWESGLTYQGKTTIVSGNVIRKAGCADQVIE